jgi:hypothetical protein
MIILTNEILMIGVLFSMLPSAEADVIHCHRDVTCVLLMDKCMYIRVCGQNGICVCIEKEEATLKVNETTPK